jgi:hypothetical protein
MSDRLRPAIGFDDPGDHLRVRDVFAEAGYSEEGLRERLGVSDLLEIRSVDVPAALRRTRDGAPRDTLIRLFFLGVPVEPAAARRAAHPMPLEGWAQAGLVALAGDHVVPLAKVSPYRGLLLAADMPTRMRPGGPADFVLGLSRSSVLVSHTMIPRPVRQTLDLGAGCGILAFLASRHSGQVYATDKNARAVDFARFNARLNDIANVQCLTGDLFEPVADQRFDLVISNPPYVIAPAVRHLFADSGVRGDEFCRRLVRLASSFLEDGGFAQIMGNWAHRASQSWEEPLSDWFDGIGCDVLVWASGTHDASTYGLNWIQQTEPDHAARLGALYDDWMRYYDREGIEAVTYGLIAMRRRPDRPGWVRFVKVPKGSSAPTGSHVLRRFQLHDFLESTGSAEALLDHRFRLSPDVRLEQHYAPNAGGLTAVISRLHLAPEPAFYTMDVDSTVAMLIMYQRGERILREVFAEMSTAMQVDLDHLVPGGLPVARRLVEQGFLLPPSVPDR